MDSTLDKRIAAMRGSLMNTALEAAESRGQRLAGVAHVLYALYRDDGFAGRLLRAHGLESAEIRRLMGTVPNMPLADGGKPVPNLSTRRILKHANDTLEILRYLQGNDQVAGLLASHGIGKPDRQPTQAQVLAAAQASVEVAGLLAPGRDYGMDPSYLARVRLMLEAALDGDSEMNARTETLGEVIEWLGDEADREWERAKDGLSDGYGGFDAYMRTIQHCQDMLMDDTAEHGKPDEGGKMNKQNETVLLEHLADTFETKLRKADRSIGTDIPDPYREGRMDALGWAATYCRLLAERK